jgi:hypothetical protein
VRRVPLLFGSRVAILTATDDDVVLAPPPPGEAVADVGAAVRDALRFPLAGDPLEALVTRNGRATMVVEPPALPIPGTQLDPRQAAIAATADELERVGVPFERQTLLVAGGLARRLGHRELEGLVPPDFARRFHGRVEVHDAEDPRLVGIGSAGQTPLRVNPALVEADVVVTVTAAETVLHGGPSALVGAADPEALRAADAESLLEHATSDGWRIATSVERALGGRAPVIGVSLVLNHPVLSGALRGFPYDREAVERVARSPLRKLFGALPGVVRGRILHTLPLRIAAAAAYGGPPSVAHAEALLRATEARTVRLHPPLDAVCIGIPRTTPHLPRERPNPLLAAYLALALALRLWRDGFPLAEGGTAILLSRFHRSFAHPTQQPYRAFFHALRGTASREPADLLAAEQAARRDERAVAAYRDGTACHPLLPFADWAACAPALRPLGAVLVGGCRDAVAARQLGFVPTHGIGAALAMARARAGGRTPRVGFLLSPPYFPIRVGPEA